ncbi:hypothetical protein [Streptomyces phaeochromogenes]|uniref:hypothetical protein n=1 Tax=Streptomyces phaeochromogenes TaxID=1923 RepID=UPI002DDA3AAD|nr:hypothetical protein [Streptomyces phaeochromogenes]WRZ29990.1 hypothetical protein OG931_20675 [Streptomyces phaeochromogenes]
MRMRTLARHRLDGAGWAHPYPLTPFSPFVHASGAGDGGQGAGGDGGANAGQQGGDEGQGGTGSGGQDPTGQQAQGAPAQQPAEGDIKTLPEWAQKVITDARGEAGKARTTAKQHAADEARQQLAQDIGKALGLVTDDKPADPAQLTAQVTDLSGQLRSARVELAAYRAAGTEGANADRLLNSRGFGDKLAALDPSDEKFAEQLKKAITDEVATDPGLYRATPAGPARGGAEFNGPPTGDRKPATLNDAIAARLGR